MQSIHIKSSQAILFLFAFLSISGLYGQNKQSANFNYSGTVTGLSFKRSLQPEPGKVRGEDIIWKRDVYRILDLNVSENAPLYYPTEASADKKNLFSTIFEAIANNNLTAYEYLDGREVFTDQYAIKFKDLLKRFEIPFKEKSDPKRPNVTIFDIDAVDIPTSEVTLFYVKEVMYLDQRTSSMQLKTTAICPVLVRTDDMGETRRLPMFWVPFESLMPFLSGQSIAADSLNSAERISLYDYFNQHRYKGTIYKVSNLKNQNIWDYCKTPEAVKAEQDRLENELKNIGNSLWEPNQRDVLEAKEKALKASKAKATAPDRSNSTGKK